MFKYYQLVVQTSKELQIIFQVSNISSSKMEELERQITVTDSYSGRVFHVTVADADFGSLKDHL